MSDIYVMGVSVVRRMVERRTVTGHSSPHWPTLSGGVRIIVVDDPRGDSHYVMKVPSLELLERALR